MDTIQTPTNWRKEEDNTGIVLSFNDFQYDDDYEKCTYEYTLDKEDVHKLLNILADLCGLDMTKGDGYWQFLSLIISSDEEDIYRELQPLTEEENSKLVKRLKTVLRDKAFSEFKKAFDYYYAEDDEERREYERSELFDEHLYR